MTESPGGTWLPGLSEAMHPSGHGASYRRRPRVASIIRAMVVGQGMLAAKVRGGLYFAATMLDFGLSPKHATGHAFRQNGIHTLRESIIVEKTVLLEGLAGKPAWH